MSRGQSRQNGRVSPPAAKGRLAKTTPIERRQRGFTLTEMLVALAVMVLAMAMVTSVFSVTTKTAAMSAAVADVELILRNAAEELRRDLEHCNPAESVLYIHGRTQAAALTEELRQAGRFKRFLVGDPANIDTSQDPRFWPTPPRQYSDPRADVLMFFTNRPTISRAPAQNPQSGIGYPEFQRALVNGLQHYPIQVVYGHAAVAEPFQRSSGAWEFGDAKHIQDLNAATNLSRLPLTRWQLARRATLLYDPPGIYSGTPGISALDMKSIVDGYRQDLTLAADTVIFRFRDFLKEVSPRLVNQQLVGVAEHSPYLFSPGSVLPGISYSKSRWDQDKTQLIRSLIYPTGDEAVHHFATILENPPAALGSNVNLRLVPGCVWFKVEILIPEDPRNSRQSPLSNQRTETPRWVEVEPGVSYCFVPDSVENRELIRGQVFGGYGGSPNNVDAINARIATFRKLVPNISDLPGSGYPNWDTVDNRIIRMWPYAIRVTLRAIDRNGRLEEPITRSVVHWFE